MRAAARGCVWIALVMLAMPADARTVHRCLRDGTYSISTAPEPGSRCKAMEVDDQRALGGGVWRAAGIRQGVIYRREQDGRTVYGTRKLPGAVAVQSFAVSARCTGCGSAQTGRPRLRIYAEHFRDAARSAGMEEAWLRAVAHVESGFNAHAVSRKGARGVMQLMPATARHLRVSNPFDAGQSIRAGARHLRALADRFEGDLALVAAAYNAGIGAVKRHGGIPPYPETRRYVSKVLGAYARYRAAMQASGSASDRDQSDR